MVNLLNNTPQRIDLKEAKSLYLNASDEELKELAHKVKSFYHNPLYPTYIIMAIINYTNICVAACDYCSFYRLKHDREAYLLSHEDIFRKIEALKALGGTLIGFNGGFHPDLHLKDYGLLFKKIRERYKDELEFYELTIAEFMFICKRSKVSYVYGAQYLKDHGVHWITGGGAEILEDSFRARHSPGKYSVADYYTAQKAVLASGIGSTATMVIGFDENLEERFMHIESLRRFQDESLIKLPSFLCWTYKPFGNRLGKSQLKEIKTSEYLRWISICRIFLDNIPHIRTSVLTKNKEAMLGLAFGADDFDLPTEDEVTQKAGATISHDFDTILEHAKKLGFEPKHRKPFGLRGEIFSADAAKGYVGAAIATPTLVNKR